ncbi:MAG: DNA starvation/stationary phase protection protein, partial [Bacteroidia bacterium]|nr:DNA starvation/stationary phase protection protein [Bacteroidia bacterium]
MKPQIGITDKYLNQINVLLTLNLSNAMAVYIKSKKAHWNVSGESFMELHKLFEDHYTQLEESIDKTAERIVKLGGQAIG